MAAQKKKMNLALQGGGAHGAFAVGALDHLLQHIEIDSVSATSAGAVNAVVLAQGMIRGGNEGARKALFEFWRDVSDCGEIYSPVKISFWESLFGVHAENSVAYQTFNWMTENFSPYQFNPSNFNPLRELLERHIDFDQLRNTDKIKLFICATNVKTGKIKIFDNQELSVEAVLASSCLPYLFQAVEIGENYYWDGGFMGNPAIFPLIYHSAVRDILIMHINPIVREKVPETPVEIRNRMNEISFNSSLMREMRAIKFVTRLLDENWIKEEHRDQMKRIFIHSLRSDELMMEYSVASKFDTEWDFLSELFELGRIAGDKWFKKNHKKIGKSSTIDIKSW